MSTSIVAARGADISLLDMVGDFLESPDCELPSKVLTGRTPFPLAGGDGEPEERKPGSEDTPDYYSD